MTPQDATEVAPFLTSAATIVFIQKWLKTTHAYAAFVQAFPGTDKWAHRFVGGVGALIAAAGIHVVWNWNIETGGTLSAAIPGLMAMVHGLSDFFKVYILQHTIHEATNKSAYLPNHKGGA